MHLLSVAFLCAQFGILAHASTHLKADPHGVPATQLCGECLSSAPLLSMVGGAPTIVLAIKALPHRIDDAQAIVAPLTRAFCAFRSRAPPTFL